MSAPSPPSSSRWKPAAVRVQAPLKLVLAGEYAVLDQGSLAIVAAVARHVSCRAAKAKDGVAIAAASGVRSAARAAGPGPDGALRFEPAADDDARRLAFLRVATEVAYRYVADLGLEPRPLSIECESDAGYILIPERGAPGRGEELVKIGLGTSAAATVAAVGAVLAAHGVPIDRLTFRRALFRLAFVAHARAQGGRGSGVDIASSTYGGLLEYGRADPRWMRRVEQAGATPLEIARGPWPGQHLDLLPVPEGMKLLAGFTGAASATGDLLAAVERWKKARPVDHESFVRLSQRAARGLALAFRKGDRSAILAGIELARNALVYLGERAGLEIETEPLRRLAEIAHEAGAAGKLSGAGGGDCGYAICWDEMTARKVEAGWRDAGIVPIRLEVARGGVVEVPVDGGSDRA